jgi:hypothetical protein
MRRFIKGGLILGIGALTLIGGCGSDGGEDEIGAGTSRHLRQLRPPPDFDRRDTEAVRRAVENDLKALEAAGVMIGLVDSTAGRVRILVEDLTPAKKQLLEERYVPLLDVESGTVRPLD